MHVGFQETMAGTFRGNDGASAPMIFTVEVNADGPHSFATGKAMALKGTLSLGGVVRDAAATGTLEVRLMRLRGRELVYRLDFEGPDGEPMSYMARKTVKLRNVLKGMTTLRGRVYRGMKAIGEAELTFDLRHIPQFLRSFRLSS